MAVKVVIMKNIKNTSEMQEEGALLECWQECKLPQPLWKSKKLKKLKLRIGLSFDPPIA